MHLKEDLASADGVRRVAVGARERDDTDLVKTIFSVGDLVVKSQSLYVGKERNEVQHCNS